MLNGYIVFTGMGGEKNLFGKIVAFVTSSIFSVFFTYLLHIIANFLQISFPTLLLVSEPPVRNVILTNNYRGLG